MVQPRLYDVLALADQPKACALVRGSERHYALPHPLPCTSEHLSPDRVLFLDAGMSFYLW
jgi:hypothetical protein